MKIVFTIVSDEVHKEVYINQKGGFHEGDFSRIAAHLNVSLEAVSYFCIIFAALCMIIPAGFFFYRTLVWHEEF